MSESPAQTMYELIRDFYRLNRSALNQDTDMLVSRVSEMLECPTLEIPSGKECLN